jgi:hypothetical protein
VNLREGYFVDRSRFLLRVCVTDNQAVTTYLERIRKTLFLGLGRNKSESRMLATPKLQRPRSNSAGPPVVCLGLAEGAKAFCESELRQDLIAHALSLSHLTFVTTIRIFHVLWIALLSRVCPY